MTVRTKLLALNILLVGASLLFMGLALRARLYANLSNDIDGQLESEVGTGLVSSSKGFSDLALPGPGDALRSGGQRRTRVVSNTDSGVVQVLRMNSDAIYLKSNPSFPVLVPIGMGLESRASDPVGVNLAESRGRSFHEFVLKGRPMRSLSVPISIHGRTAAVVQAVKATDSLRTQIAGLDRSLLMLSPFAVLLSGLLGFSLVGITMRPLKRLNDSANRLAPDLSGDHLPVAGRDEFAQLAQTFNAAFDRTATAFDQQRQAIAQLERFTGDAGHELRTPLASIKSGTSHLLHKARLTGDNEKTVRLMDRSADRMAKLIDDLLLLSRQDSGQRLCLDESVEIAGIFDEAREEMPERPGVEVEIEIDRGLAAKGNAAALRRVFLNLLSNAVGYADSRVRVIGQSVGNWAEILVEDDGCGIAPECLSRLGERFYRPDAARSRELGGTGLGLAIAKSLVAAHGGELLIESEVGRGTVVTVKLARALISQERLQEVAGTVLQD